jgi:hypothetical protein
MLPLRSSFHLSIKKLPKRTMGLFLGENSMMKKQFILVIALLALVSMMIAPVSAEIILGTLGGSSTGSYSYNSTPTSGAFTLSYLGVTNIENSIGTKGYVHFDVAGYLTSYDDATESVGNIPFELLNTSESPNCVIARGTFGYQRSYDAYGVEIPGYQWLEFDSWENLSYITGSHSFLLVIDVNAAHNPLFNAGSPYLPTSNGDMAFAGAPGVSAVGNHLRNVELTTYAEYTAVRPLGIGIEVLVTKLHGGVTYPSRAYVFNGTSGEVIGNNPTVNTNNLYFSLLDQPLKIGIQDPLGNWYNTSVLFASGIPTPVPTVTPTPVPTIPLGYVRSIFTTIDGMTGYDIHGTNIMLRDVEAATWTNTTSDPDGSLSIDTLPYHTINAYATYTAEAGIYSDGELLGVTTPYAGTSHNYITMYPPALSPGTGNTNLYITARDYDTYLLLTSASIKYTSPTGATTIGSTGSSGTDIQNFPNNTAIIVAASKTGYKGASITVNTGTGTTKSATIYLSKATVTTAPTSTIPPGGVTPVVTQDPNDPSLHGGDTSMKAQEMMNWLAMHGMDLVQLCFLVTIFALLGVKLGK